MRAEADIRPGICGFRTLARAETSDGRTVQLDLETDCDNRVLKDASIEICDH